MDEFNLTLAVLPSADCKNWLLLAVNDVDGLDPSVAFLYVGERFKAMNFANDLAALSKKYGASVAEKTLGVFNGKKGKENFKAR